MTNYDKWIKKLPLETIAFMHAIQDNIAILRSQNKAIYPEDKNIMSALQLVAPDDVKVLILGQDPYHQPGQATGTAFSVNDGITSPPSLRNIFTELVDDCTTNYPQTSNLAPWAKQGVLLLNTSLTVEHGKPGSHADVWLSVTKAIIITILNTNKPLVILCWSSPAINLINDCMAQSTGSNNFILKSTHPSPFSANKASSRAPAFIGSRPFSKTNDLLIKNGLTPIDWRL